MSTMSTSSYMQQPPQQDDDGASDDSQTFETDPGPTTAELVKRFGAEIARLESSHQEALSAMADRYNELKVEIEAFKAFTTTTTTTANTTTPPSTPTPTPTPIPATKTLTIALSIQHPTLPIAYPTTTATGTIPALKARTLPALCGIIEINASASLRSTHGATAHPLQARDVIRMQETVFWEEEVVGRLALAVEVTKDVYCAWVQRNV